MAGVRQLLESTPIAGIVGGRTEIVELDVEATLEEAIQILVRNKLLSAPVKDPAMPGQHLGLLDVKDVMMFALRLYTKDGNVQRAETKWEQNVEKLQDRGIEYALQPVGELMEHLRLTPFICFSSKDSLLDLVEVDLIGGCHRAAVVNQAHKIEHIVSQSDVIPHLVAHMDLLGETRRRTVAQLALGTRSLVSIFADEPAIHGFHQMYCHRVSAVAVVDRSTGELVANLSISDIRSLDLAHWTALLKPATRFLQSVRSKAPVTCTLASTLESVLTRLHVFRVHRLWVVDEASKPVGVVSMSDVLRVLSSLK